MRILLAAAAVVILFSCTPVYAADKGGPWPAPAGSLMDAPADWPDVWNHDGVYVGAAIGYSSAAFDGSYEDIAADVGDQGAFGGVYLGAGRVVSGLYLGIEGDFMLTDIKAEVGDSEFQVTGKNAFLASIRGRVGLPMGPALAYLTAGPAWTNAKLSYTADGTSESDDEILTGIAAGGGLEFMLGKSASIRLEGLHYAFPDQDLKLTEDHKLEVERSETVIRAGLGFRF